MQEGIPCWSLPRRVHAARRDGFFRPASLEGQSSTREMFAVTFDDGHKEEVSHDHIIGTGFQSMNDVQLKQGQRVLYCAGGRYYEADVLEYNVSQRHALVSLNDGTELVVKPSDLRLPPEYERRGSLDDGYTSASPDTLSLSGLSPKLEKRLEDARNAKTEREAESILDECTAALVLTSLRSLPTSWDGRGTIASRVPDSPAWKGKRQPPPASPLAFAAARVGRHLSPSPSSAASTPPPEHDLTASFEETILPRSPSLASSRDSRSFSPVVRESTKYQFQFPSPTTSSRDASVWNMAALSSPLRKAEFTYKTQPITIPPSGSRLHPYADHERAYTPPRTDMPAHCRQGIDQVRPRPQQYVVSSPSRKIKTDGRKCRKVYGMENKHLWCTQCKWKKACTRFIE